MRRFNVRKSDAGHEHYLYDLSIPLPERTYKRMLFPSAVSVAAFLGVHPNRIYDSRTTKHRIWSDNQGSWFAVRLANTTKNAQ